MSSNEAGRRRAARAWIFGVAAAGVLAGCSSGDGSVGVGSGQDPDPVALDFPIAYTKGPLFNEDMELQSPTDLRELERFNVGTDLYLLDRASPSAEERNITLPVTEGIGDVRDVEISIDGTRLLFAMRGPFDENLDEDEQPSWNIWEYDIPSATLTRVIASDITAEAAHDISPHYLPDGRIVFASTRQRQGRAILLDEGKPQFEALDEDRDEPAFVLHVMNADGSDIRQISFNQSHDYDPVVLDSGRIMFSRWDNAGNVDGIHLYRMNPDGSELELMYGAESHGTGTDGGEIQFIDAREMADGRIMAIVRGFENAQLGGDIVAIDASTYVENSQPTAANAGMSGPAQRSATPNDVRTDEQLSAGGRFSDAYPLRDGTDRVLTSWAICRAVDADAAEETYTACTDEALADPAADPAPPLYGVWMYDPNDETQLPVVAGEEGVLITDVVAAQPRSTPQAIPEMMPAPGLGGELAGENAGILNIRSVYDVDGVDTAEPDIETLADPREATAAERPARFLRVVKAVSIPDDDVVELDNTAFGPNANLGMREIVAYAPIEPDGSVRVKVPANVPLGVSVLDANGRRVSARHQNWLQVRPGEEIECNGCHDPDSGLSHGRRGSFDSVHEGAPATGVPFPGTVSSLSPDFGETMAETRTRVSCQLENCAALEPSLDVVYEDHWTDAGQRDPDEPFAYEYTGPDGLTTAVPTTQDCFDAWSTSCRTIINYETHIHPLWMKVREVLDENMNVVEDNTCAQSGCHLPEDTDGVRAVPAAQLNLSGEPSPQQMDHLTSYRELLFQDFEQELVNGALADVLVEVGLDEDGEPILEPVTVAPPMSAAGANASDDFFSKFAPGGTHEGRLTPAELRLISEWLDLGAQYYNNPFDVPQD